MFKKFIAFVICVIFASCSLSAQEQQDTLKTSVSSKISPHGLDILHAMEDSLLNTIDSAYNAYIPDTREYYCQRLIRQLVKALKVPNSFYYPFDSLEKKMYIIYPDDKAFRIFSWYTSLSQPTRRYYGAIQMPEEDLKLYPLVDYSEELGKHAADSPLTDGKWFGAQYYRIIRHTVGVNKVYTLFGMNAGSAISNKKVMDPLIFTDKGPVFGAQVFDVRSETDPGQMVYRFILEYKKGVSVSMNWDNELNCVYFDKLTSQINDPNRKYTFVPSGSYDGFRWEDEMWKYKKDLIPVQILGDDNAPQGDKPFNSK